MSKLYVNTIYPTGTTGSLSSSIAFHVNMADDVGGQDGDNGAFIFKDSASDYLTFITRAEEEEIIIGKSITHRSEYTTDPGTGFDVGAVESFVAKTNGEIVTTLIIDLSQGDIFGKNTANDIIGENNSNPAYLTRVEDNVNGIIYKGEMICIEVPEIAGSAHADDGDLDLYASSLATSSYDNSATGMQSGHTLVNGGTWTAGGVTNLTIPAGGLTNDYLYLATGTGTTAGEYDTGKMMIKLYGGAAPEGGG
jgi:hypothetical protein